MKTLKRPLVLVSSLIIVTLFLSWTLLEDRASVTDNNASPSISDEQLIAFMTESGGSGDTSEEEDLLPPAAEDVLVQRIPGDKQHLRLMAYYSKENFSRPSFTIESGYTLTFSDDGKGADKKAGDGLYSAIVPVDVVAFRKQAVQLAQQMKNSGYKPIRFIRRQMVLDPDLSEGFEANGFDINQPVSISGITNALSGDLPVSTNIAALTTNGSSAKSTATAASVNTAKAATKTAKVTTLDSVKKNSVFITDLGVVEDPTRTWNYCSQTGNATGAWTFGTLMRQLASKSPSQIATDAQVSTFVKNWLNSWATTQVINGDTVEARTLVNTKILNPWLNKSKSAGAPSGQLDMKFAPFKLTAIVNRFDLRDGQKFGVPGAPCGEARFVFCLVKNDCSGMLPMTIILEYGVNKPNTCEGKRDWAQQWVNLKNFALGSSEYNQALQKITDQFTLCGTNPDKPNQSSLNQLRTNEIALAPTTPPRRWELREFTLDGASGNLKETTVGQTPADKYNAQVVNADVQRLASFVNNNKKSIKSGIYTVPLVWKNFPFLGGKSRINATPTGAPPKVYHWDGTDSTNKPTFIVDNDARSNFSLETCSGCHAGEAQTGFTHVDTAFYGKEAALSGFLTGIAGSGGAVDFDNDPNNSKLTVKDAALRPSSSNPKLRTFNDIKRRASALNTFASTTCGSVLGISSQLMFEPTNMVH